MDQRMIKLLQEYRIKDLDLREAMKSLTVWEYEIVILHLVGYTQAEIGVAYNVSRQFVTVKWDTILGKLREHLLCNLS